MSFILSTPVLLCLLVAILCIAANKIVAADVNCRALALGGGADRGAYEAGVIKALVEQQNPTQTQYEVVSGISAGSINSAAFSQFKIGDEHAAKEFLVDRWLNTHKDDIYKNWVGTVVEGFFFKSGLFDTAPLKNYIHKYIDADRLRSSGRHLIVGATDLAGNRFTTWNQTSPDILEAIRASSSVPGVFPTVRIGEKTYVDGGASSYIDPVTSAIQRCHELHPNDNVNVHVDIVLALSDADYPGFLEKFSTTPFVLLHTLFGLVQQIFVQDIQNARIAYPQASLRVFKPQDWLPGKFLFFDHSKQMIDMGYKDASSIIERTQTHSGNEEVLHEMLTQLMPPKTRRA